MCFQSFKIRYYAVIAQELGNFVYTGRDHPRALFDIRDAIVNRTFFFFIFGLLNLSFGKTFVNKRRMVAVFDENVFDDFFVFGFVVIVTAQVLRTVIQGFNSIFLVRGGTVSCLWGYTCTARCWWLL